MFKPNVLVLIDGDSGILLFSWLAVFVLMFAYRKIENIVWDTLETKYDKQGY